MKVGIAAPLSLAAVNGGVRTQVLETVRHLNLLGIDAEIICPNHPHFEFDIVHVFSASPETIGIAKHAKNNGTPLVVTPVFYSNRTAKNISRALKIEGLISKIGSGIRSEYGIKAEICGNANKLLPNTTDEKKLLQNAFRIHDSKLSIVPNGVESRFSEASASMFTEKYGLKDFVLFAGQAGAERKNVIQLLRVAKSLKHDIVIIGDFYTNDYSIKCLSLASNAPNVHLIPTLPHKDELLASAFAACKVFCLPSMFETPGIAAMEAALGGANIVITQNGGTKEYFNEMAHYSNPNSDQSLLAAVTSAIETPKSEQLKKHILSKYTWEKIAAKTAQEYAKLI